MKSFAPVNEKEFETASQTRKHQITWPMGIRLSPSLRGKATSFLTTWAGQVAEGVSKIGGLVLKYGPLFL